MTLNLVVMIITAQANEDTIPYQIFQDLFFTYKVSVKTPEDQFDDLETTNEFQFPIGTSIVSYKYTDSFGNDGFCSFEVTVKGRTD